MLGENHSLINEFPEYEKLILVLNAEDKTFADQAKLYHRLDTEIRNLELKSAPINDESMHQLKHQRANLKDSLYQRLKSEK